ncbi:MAG TPA: hypothetical protein VNP72_01950 [Longimicrobium sp.]|nr:hypothetical protein [Longimicrobium sp.]
MGTMIRRMAAAAVLAALAACGNDRAGTEVRTFVLHTLTVEDASALLTPYVRQGGFLSGRRHLLTVRESSEQLDTIAAVLQRYDGAPEIMSLHFQVIEAGDFAGGDSAIARVEAPLREMLRYRGYRLVRDVTVQAVEGRGFSHKEEDVQIEGVLTEVTATGPNPSVTLDVGVMMENGEIKTSVSGQPGKTLVIGTQKQQGGAGAVILVVRPTALPAAPRPGPRAP